MTLDYENMSLAEQIKSGLRDSIAFTRGQLALPTTRLPAPPPPIRATGIIRIRKRLNMSQNVFAATLNVSPKTVQSWEQGVRRPSQGTLRLLEIFDRQPDVVEKFFELSVRCNTPRKPVRTDAVKGRRGFSSAARTSCRGRIRKKTPKY
jgi:DNA-binding transcriptional regulator YiaG